MNGDCERLLLDCENELNQIKEWVDNNILDSNVRFLTLYSVIKSCSTIEVITKRLIYNYLSQNGNAAANKYLEKAIIDSSTNPKTGNIEKILQQIDNSLKETFHNQINEPDKINLNSLVRLRNDFAHGSNVNESINTVVNYFQSGKHILNQLNNILFQTI